MEDKNVAIHGLNPKEIKEIFGNPKLLDVFLKGRRSCLTEVETLLSRHYEGVAGPDRIPGLKGKLKKAQKIIAESDMFPDLIEVTVQNWIVDVTAEIKSLDR